MSRSTTGMRLQACRPRRTQEFRHLRRGRHRRRRRPSAARRSRRPRWRNRSPRQWRALGQLRRERADEAIAGPRGVDGLDGAARHEQRLAFHQREHPALSQGDADRLVVPRLASDLAASAKRAGSSLSRRSVFASSAEFGFVEHEDVDEIVSSRPNSASGAGLRMVRRSGRAGPREKGRDRRQRNFELADGDVAWRSPGPGRRRRSPCRWRRGSRRSCYRHWRR